LHLASGGGKQNVADLVTPDLLKLNLGVASGMIAGT
jgi:hypothetical protein